jgi:hypothetical protein
MIVESGRDDNLAINWSDLLANDTSEAVTIPNAVNALGLIVTKVFFWNDTSNTGRQDLDSNVTDLRDWNQFTVNDIRQYYSANKDLVKAEFDLTDVDYGLNVSVLLRTTAAEGRTNVSPRLSYTPTSFHVEIVIRGAMNDSIVKQRVGLEFALLHKPLFALEQTKAIDDEYSPGVFTKMTAKFNEEHCNSYMGWKPVGYAKADRIIAHTVDALMELNPNETNVEDLPIDNSPLYAFFSAFGGQVTKFNLTFGSTNEPLYKASNYTSFSLVIGLGAPAQDHLSFLVEMIILVGFGLPIIAIVLSAFYLCIKRLRRRNYDELIVDGSPD